MLDKIIYLQVLIDGKYRDVVDYSLLKRGDRYRSKNFPENEYLFSRCVEGKNGKFIYGFPIVDGRKTEEKMQYSIPK